MQFLGAKGQAIGRAAELAVINDISGTQGWSAANTVGTELDHGAKTDAVVHCPNGETMNIQISRSPKSRRTRTSLRDRGVTPVAEENRLTSVQQICAFCALQTTCQFTESTFSH